MKKPASKPETKKPADKKPEAANRPKASQNLGKNQKRPWDGYIVVITAIVFYFNSLWNEHALDDIMMITHNMFVLKGIAGIKGIMTKDSLVGFIGNASNLPGGRYRPLSLVMFALEWEFFGDNPHIGHFINVSLFALTCWVFWLFLKKYIFKNNKWGAFIAAMVFAIHPIHTEVIANIKSRDEILSLLFSLLSLYYLFEFTEGKRKDKYLLFSGLFFFLGLFSKENTIMYLAVFPIAFYCFSKNKLKQNIRFIIPHFLLALVFILIRFAVIGNHHGQEREVLNNPFLTISFANNTSVVNDASFTAKYATIFLTLLFYLKLLFFPYPLSHDYSFNQIPLTDFTDWRVILSLAIYFALFIWAIMNLKKKSLISFGILYFIITLSITSNLVFNIGAPMGERFLYMPSVGFAIVLAVLCWKAYSWFIGLAGNKVARPVSLGICAALVIAAAGETFERNSEWRNDITLDIHDADVVPRSAIANQRCGTAYINLADSIAGKKVDTLTPAKHGYYLDKAIRQLRKSLEIYPTYRDAFINLSVAYIDARRYDDAEKAIGRAKEIDPDNNKVKEITHTFSNVYLQKAIKARDSGNLDHAYINLLHAEKIAPDNPVVYDNLGGYYYTVQNFAKAKESWEKCLSLDPANADAKKGLNAKGMPR